MSEIKTNTVNKIKCRLDSAKEKVSELEDIAKQKICQRKQKKR